MFKNHNDMDVEKEENENQFKKYVSDFLKLINSTKVGTFIIIVTILLISLFTVEKCTSHFLIRGMVENELASLQTSTAVMANEFSEYLTIHDAEKGGVYDLLKHYSAMNYMRIRVIDERFVIVLDSYYTEYSRSMINPNVLNSYKNKKNVTTNKITDVEAKSIYALMTRKGYDVVPTLEKNYGIKNTSDLTKEQYIAILNK